MQSPAPAIRRHAVLGLVLSLAASAAPLVAGEDMVLLRSGHRIAGVIDPAASSGPGLVAVRTAEGVIQLRGELIAGAELSYESRRAQVKDDDAAGLTALARWCLAKGMAQQARELLELAVRTPAPGADAHGLLARLIDAGGDPEKSLPLYRAYRAAGGTDAELLGRLQQLEEYERTYQARLTASQQPQQTATATTVASINDGLEARGWDAESTQWSNPVTATQEQLQTPEGVNRVLRVEFRADPAGAKEKAAIRRSVRALALGQTAMVRCYAFNPGDRPLRLALAIKTVAKKGNEEQWEFFESQQFQIKPGDRWQEVKFDLKDKTWKSAATGWANSGSIQNLDDVREMQLLVYNGASDGALLLDGIEFLGPKDM